MRGRSRATRSWSFFGEIDLRRRHLQLLRGVLLGLDGEGLVLRWIGFTEAHHLPSRLDRQRDADQCAPLFAVAYDHDRIVAIDDPRRGFGCCIEIENHDATGHGAARRQLERRRCVG
jgi:hypothetical protein